MQQYHLVLVIIILMFLGLYRNWAKPSALFSGTVLLFLVLGILSPEEVLKGFSNKQIFLIFLLIILSLGLRKAFGAAFFRAIFKPGLSAKAFLLRLMIFVSSVSAFINNTPIVAFMIPYVKEWADTKQLPPSKFLIPLSFATIMGGMITVVGTSTNLLLMGLIHDSSQPLLHYRDFLFLGIITTVIGILYIYFIGYRLLPEKKSPIKQMEEHMNEYVVETIVSSGSVLIGKSISEAQLRNLREVYLFEINRDGRLFSPVAPEEIIKEGDHLFFSGKTTAIAKLVREIKGLVLPDSKTLSQYNHHHFIEAIIPGNSSLTGKIVRESDFRKSFDASIISIHRSGKRLSDSVGETELKAGDLLLMLGNSHTPDYQGDLLILKKHDENLSDTGSIRIKTITGFIVIVLLVAGITNLIDLFTSSLISIVLFTISGNLNFNEVKKNFDFDLAVMLISSLAIGLALSKSGAADLLVNYLLNSGDNVNAFSGLVILFIVTLVITAFITNAAAISIVFPLALSMASTLQMPPAPFFVAIAFAASADFITPIGYQTNLMVYGPGNYTFRDFARIGLPLTLLYLTTCLLFIYWYYNF